MKISEDKKFQYALVISTILHIILIGIFIFGVPSFFEKLPPEENVITFEMLQLSEVVNVKIQSPNTKPQEDPEKAKKVEKAKKPQETKPEEKKEEPKKQEEAKKAEPETKQEEEKPKEPLKTTKAEPVAPKKEEKEPLNKKTLVKKEEKKDTPKPKPKQKKQEEDIIDSLLKNLEEASEGEQTKSDKKIQETTDNKGKYARSERFDEESPLSMTELMLIRQQIEKNWNLQRFLGINGIQEIKIFTYIKLNQKGEIVDAIIVKNHCPPHMSDICKSLAESVIQAIWSSNPIENLVPTRYNIWGELNITFTPGNLLP